MSALVRVTNVVFLGGRSLSITFSDGLVRELDFTGTLVGLLAELDDLGRFSTVGVDPITGTLCWPDGIDLDPDVLHGDAAPATAMAPRVIREYRLEQSR